MRMAAQSERAGDRYWAALYSQALVDQHPQYRQVVEEAQIAEGQARRQGIARTLAGAGLGTVAIAAIPGAAPMALGLYVGGRGTYSATSRSLAGQTAGQVVAGTFLDVSGATDFWVGAENRDIATGQYVGAWGAQRGGALASGALGVTGSAMLGSSMVRGGMAATRGLFSASRGIEVPVSRGAQLRAQYGYMTAAQRQARIQELAMGNRVLREAGVPRQYISEALQSFVPGTITTRLAGENEFGLRFYGGVSGPRSPYLQPTFPGGDVRSLTAPPPGNTLQSIKQWQIRPGVPLLEGRIRANFGQPGGGSQIYVPDFYNNLLEP